MKVLKFLKRFYIIIIIFLFLIFLLSRGIIYDKQDLSYGVTYSEKQARDLGFDEKVLYLEMLDDLNVKKLRLSAYWDELEKERNDFDFANLDWFIDEASKRDVEIVLAIGQRLPRWPECHIPKWVDDLNQQEKNRELFDYIEKVILRYKNKSAIKYWQVENEPFLPMFGECPEFDQTLLDEEIELVKSLDAREIILTDSGELSLWVPAVKRSDIFGTTMYRDTYSEKLKSYIHYPIEPGFFRFKKNIVRFFANPKKWIVIELQAEPWGPKPFQNLNQEERDKTMNLEKFKEIIDFSHKAGFNEFYLWGVEWWYWEKETQGNPGLWEEAKSLF